MNHRLSRPALGIAALAAIATFGSSLEPAIAASATPDSGPAIVARLFVRFLIPANAQYSSGDWNMAREVQGVRWGKGPIMLDKPAPDGAFFAMPGRMTINGRQAIVVANGARTMAGSFYVLDPVPPENPARVAAAFRGAGFTLTPARCPIDSRDYPDSRRWYRITYPAKRPAFLHTARTKSGGAGYVLYLGELPAMTDQDAARLTDDCVGGTAPAAGFRTGAEAATTLIDRLIPSTTAPAALPWSAVEALPSTKWGKGPGRFTIPYPGGGADPNPYTLSGTLDTPTTQSEMRATGTAGAATRFYFRYLDHIRPGDVFGRLGAKGYRITTVRCGKAYTKMSENWFSIRAPGKRPAILYRAISHDLGPTKVTFVLRIDNVMPPIEQGQRAAPRSGCPG
jgi:hypothetical protein